MVIGIFGSSGFVGQELASFLENRFIVLRFGRKELALEDALLAEHIAKCDIVINLVGANILRRWTGKAKLEILESRTRVTEKLIRAIFLCAKRPKTFISASAIGIYKPGERHDEYSRLYGSGFLGRLVLDWEDKIQKARELHVRTVVMRLGIVLGKSGGMLKMLLPLFRWGMGGRIGSGNTTMSFIGVYDLCRAVEFFIVNNELEGIFNLCTPDPTTNSGFTRAFAKAVKRRAFLIIPELGIKAIFGKSASVILEGAEIIPKRLLDAGFSFKNASIRDTIESELDSKWVN